MTKTLITGGTGFIGAEIARMILAADPAADVHVTHRSNNLGRLAGIEDSVTLHHLDLTDYDSIDRVMTEVAPDRLFHFGAMLTGPGEEDPQTLLAINATGFIRTIEAARVAGVTQMIFASSIGTYGRDLAVGPISDLSLQRPVTAYGVTKVFGENLGAWYRSKYGLDFRSLRYPSIVGPGVTTWSLAQYTSWMIEKPAQGEPFEVWAEPGSIVAVLHYKDAARAALELSAAPIDRIEAINYLVNGPPAPSAGDIADAVKRQLPDAQITFKPDPALGGPRRIILDDQTARTEWGWAHEYSLDDMVTDTIEQTQTA